MSADNHHADVAEGLDGRGGVQQYNRIVRADLPENMRYHAIPILPWQQLTLLSSDDAPSNHAVSDCL